MRLVLALVPVVVLVTAVGLVMVLERVLARNVAMVMDALIRACLLLCVTVHSLFRLTLQALR
jgi:hypothetical protein